MAVLVIAATHIFFPAIDRATVKYRRLLLPFVGGIAIGYVFLYMLPKLSDYTGLIIKKDAGGWEFAHYRLYLLALAGFLVYLAIDRLTVRAQVLEKRVRLVQAAGFCMYNILTGYILYNLPRPGILPYILGTFALCLHFIGVDHQLRHWHEAAYDRYLRWLISISILAGWGLSMFFKLPKEFLMNATAFLSGGIIINVMTEEIPDSSKDRLAPFLAGVVCFVLITIIARSIPKASF